MKVKIRNKGEFQVEGIRVETKNKEYLLKDCADGITIIEIGSEVIKIQPQVANSIVILDK